MSARPRRKPHCRAAWLAAFALLLQALMPALHHPGSMALAGTPAFAESHHLCLAPGSSPVLPADTDKAPAHHQPACAICQAVHAIGGFAPPPAPALVRDVIAGPSFAQIPPAAPVTDRYFRRQQPRAPPSLA